MTAPKFANMPTLLEHALAYARLIPGAKVVTVPKCGHVPQLEKPDVFLSTLESFLDARKRAA